MQILQTRQHQLGEGILWHPTEKRPYWIDIYAGTVYRQDPASGHIEQLLALDVPLGAIGFRESGGLIMATQEGFARCNADFQQVEFLHNPEATRSHARFNDGAVDAAGRFWAGTMQDGGQSNQRSSVYRFDPDGSVHVMAQDYTLVNGMGWSPDQRTMYITDSLQHVIWQYDFDLEHGTISNQRPFVRTEGGEPDGLCVDAAGFVWSARWGAGKIYRYDPAGNLERSLDVPAPHPTNCAFGGQNLQSLYISSATIALDEDERRLHPHAGKIFLEKTAFRGQAEYLFKG